MFESGNICRTTILQNARTHRPRGIIKTIQQPILHRTQVLYFCSGNSDLDPNNKSQSWTPENAICTCIFMAKILRLHGHQYTSDLMSASSTSFWHAADRWVRCSPFRAAPVQSGSADKRLLQHYMLAAVSEVSNCTGIDESENGCTATARLR